MKMTLSGSGTIAGLVAGDLPDATVTSSDLASNAVDSQTLSLFNATGSAPVYACRAWVNFNGTGTVAIRASGNVSIITDNGVGDYTVNFSTAMPDTNYAVNGFCREDTSGATSGNVVMTGSRFAQSTSATRVKTYSTSTNITYVDSGDCFVSIFR